MQLWHTYPDLRLGQLVDNLAMDHEGSVSCGSIFNIEDDKMERTIDQVLEKGWS